MKKYLFKGELLIHTATGVKFVFIGVITPQFTNTIYAELLNLKTDKVERFNNSTFLNYFTTKK